MSLAEIGHTVGIELEFNDLSIEYGPLRKMGCLPRGWQVVRDGSCTRRQHSIDGVKVEIDPELLGFFRLNPGQVGGELVSPPLSMHDPDDVYKQVKASLEVLEEHGERISSLTSVHVHVFMGNLPPIRALKNLIRICKQIEAPMFRLSCAELRQHRGPLHNDYMYCRPILGLGPQYVIDDNGYWYPCFDLDILLKQAKTAEEIMQGWGCAHYQPSKWIPPRYYWVNPVPLLRQGTIEFRSFNQTHDPGNVLAWAALCRAMVLTSYDKEQVSGPDFPLGSRKDWDFDNLWNVVDKSYIEEDAVRALRRLWLKADWQPGVIGRQVNHLSKDGRTIPFQKVPARLRPDRVTEDFVRSFWNSGYWDAIRG